MTRYNYLDESNKCGDCLGKSQTQVEVRGLVNTSSILSNIVNHPKYFS